MKLHYGWVIVFTGTLVTVLAHGFGRMSYSVILPAMKEGLGLSYTQAGAIATGNFIGYLVLAVLGGLLAARFGTRRTVFVSLLVMGVSLVLTGFSKSFLFAFFMRLVTGMGNGGSYIPIMALPAAWFLVRKGLATGIVAAGIGLGLSLSGLILPSLIKGYGDMGWRLAWFLLGGLVLGGSFVCYLLLRDRPSEKGLLPYGASSGYMPVSRPPVGLFGAFKAVASDREVLKLGLAYFGYGFSYIIYLTFFVAYLTKERGMELGKAGFYLSILGFLSIFCGVVYGCLSDRIGRRNALAMAYLALAVSYILLTFPKAGLWYLFSLVIYGLSAFSVPTLMATAAGDLVGDRLAPAGLGFVTLFFGIGQAFGPFVGGLLKDLYGTFVIPLWLSTAVSVLAAFFCFRLAVGPRP